MFTEPAIHTTERSQHLAAYVRRESKSGNKLAMNFSADVSWHVPPREVRGSKGGQGRSVEDPSKAEMLNTQP